MEKKRAEAMEKSIPELKVEFLCMCVRERKNNSFKIHVIILMYMKNVILPFKKDFKFAEILTKTSFFVYFRDRPENDEGNKQRRLKKITKHASKKVGKAESDLY